MKEREREREREREKGRGNRMGCIDKQQKVIGEYEECRVGIV